MQLIIRSLINKIAQKLFEEFIEVHREACDNKIINSVLRKCSTIEVTANLDITLRQVVKHHACRSKTLKTENNMSQSSETSCREENC